MMKMYTGVVVLSVSSEIVNQLFKDKKIQIQEEWKQLNTFCENQFVVAKAGSSQSAVCRVKGADLYLIEKVRVSGLEPRNKEQMMALNVLADDKVTVVVLTGKAGTGKTLLTLAAAIQKMDDGVYDKIILTKPMSQVGKYDLGALPGEVEDKFMPYLENYLCNFTAFMPNTSIEDLIARYNIEFVPLQLIRGASWAKSFIIADEVQTLDYHEMLTLGTRTGEGSKIVIMGDLNQRDEDIPKEKTGIYKLVNSSKSKDSKLVASIELLKCERSETAMLFTDIFE